MKKVKKIKKKQKRQTLARKKAVSFAMVFALGTGLSGGFLAQSVQAEEAEKNYGQYGTFDLDQSEEAMEPGDTTADTEQEAASLGEQFSGLGKESGIVGSILQNQENTGTDMQETENSSSRNVVAYHYQEIQDSSNGKTVARCLVPTDYTVSGDVIWCGKWQSVAAPGQVYLTAMSPEQNTVMGYYSLAAYEHILDYSMGGVSYKDHQDGVFDIETMTPMLQFMKAETYCDYLAQTILSGQQLQFVCEKDVGSDLQNMMNNKANELYQQTVQLFNGTGFTVDGAYAGIAERSYSVTLDGYAFRLDVMAATDGTQFSGSTDMIYATANSSFISWESPLAFFMLTPESEYEKNQDIFDQFIWNTEQTQEFTNAFIKVKDQLVQQLRQRGGSSMADVQDYCESSVGDAMGSGATYDAEQFSDYILSQNDYTMPDGDHVKVSTQYDHVYVDDNGNLYVTDTTEQPAGTTELNPN